MRIPRELTDVVKRLLFSVGVLFPVMAGWGLFFIVVYQKKFWLQGCFASLAIGAVCWLLLCWRSPNRRGTFYILALATLVWLDFAIFATLLRHVIYHPASVTARDTVVLVSTTVLMLLFLIVAFRAKRGTRLNV